MQIEVATPEKASTKSKGDLLEKLAGDFLRIQNFEVIDEIRVTASELDLLCQHKVNRKTIYVECKAHRSPLSANILTNLLGTVRFKEYQEGWLISTGPLGKDAKGFQHEWESKPTLEAQQLSIYSPERVLDAFKNARLIKEPPTDEVIAIVQDEDLIGEWTLLITPYGVHWSITILSGGVPEGVLVFSAKTGKLVKDRDLLLNLANTDTSLNELDFDYIFRLQNDHIFTGSQRAVVEVQQGESWSDYRPARPEDFVGRKDEQIEIIHFLDNVRQKTSLTRIFAITGDSGMGKSSLIAKLRARTKNTRYRKKFFVFAVDVRAATDPNYIYSSVLEGLSQAAQNGFGSENIEKTLKISSPSTPLSSQSIQDFLAELEKNKQVVCIVFDQFEELYSKTSLFGVFEVAQRLLIATASTQSNLVLGFAWKTDSTVQQDHPAYYLWHRLADYRLEIRLRRFRHSEASSAITVFEKQLGSKLRSDLRRQLIENSQGYPWLLKKLSIHVYDQIKDGVSQSEIMNKALDVESLFKRDLQELTKAEDTCLKIIARTAPADWYEVLEASDQETLRGLQQKRLIIRSGDRINIYWDIFREYVLTNKTPFIPLTNLPSSPSLRTMLAVAQRLDHTTDLTHADLSQMVGISEKSVGNIVRDLILFGIAVGSQSQVRLSDEIENSDPKEILRKLREVLKYHALTISLRRFENAELVTLEDIIDILREINPAAQHQLKTWKIYAERIGQWLSATGYLIPVETGWKFENRGEESISPTNAQVRRYYSRHPQRYRENTLFIGDTSPFRAVYALEWLKSQPPKRWREIEKAGHRNGARTLINLRLIRNQGGKYYVSEAVLEDSRELKDIVWDAAFKEPVMDIVIDYINANPTVSAYQVGQFVAEDYERDWTQASIERIGNSLLQWATWLIQGGETGTVPKPPGRKPKNLNIQDDRQLNMLDLL